MLTYLCNKAPFCPTGYSVTKCVLVMKAIIKQGDPDEKNAKSFKSYSMVHIIMVFWFPVLRLNCWIF